MPDHVDVTLCAHCSSVLLDDEWYDVGSVKEAVDEAILRAVSVPKGTRVLSVEVSLREKDERNLEAEVKVRMVSQGSEFEKHVSTIARLKRGSCKECSKQQGSYYEATLQVRGDDRTLGEGVRRSVEQLVRTRVASMRKASRDVFISRIEKVRGGLDFYFSSGQAARAVARELQDTYCAEFKESSSLWGKRGGEEIYRMTFLVRLPSFGPGDIIESGAREYYVRSLSRGVVHAVDLITGEERPIRVKDISECSLVKERSTVLRSVVLVEKETELQVLDPDTMLPVDVRKPKGFRRKGEQVRLVKTKVGTFVLSDDW